MIPALFLDRDDTLIDTTAVTRDTPFPGDIIHPDQVRLLPGVAEALASLSLARPELALIIVSNQGGVARGHCTLDDVNACNTRLRELLRDAARVELTGVYVCPYHPKGTVEPYNVEHPDRKPSPGMLLRAVREHALDLSRSWMIGDAPRDIDAAIAAGIAPDRAMLIVKPDAASSTALGFAQAVERVVTAGR